MTSVPTVELFDFRDTSELSQAAELRASEALGVAVPRVALVLSTLTRRNVVGALTRFELVAPDEVTTESCDVYDLTIPLPAGPGIAVTRHPIGAAVIPRTTVTGFAEVLMGGPGDGEDRLPTRFERSLLCRRLGEGLAPLWDGLSLQSAEPPSLTYIDDPLPTLPLSAVAVGVAFSIGDRTWELTLVLSSALVDATLAQSNPGTGASMAKAVKDVPLDLVVAFPPIRLAAADLERIAPGDVIRLDHTVGVPLVGVVEGRPLLVVEHGTSGRRLAVRVLELLDDTDGETAASHQHSQHSQQGHHGHHGHHGHELDDEFDDDLDGGVGGERVHGTAGAGDVAAGSGDVLGFPDRRRTPRDGPSPESSSTAVTDRQEEAS